MDWEQVERHWDTDQENIPPHAVTLPLLNILVPIMEEEPVTVNDCCRQTLAIHSQSCIKCNGRLLSHPYCRPACMQLASISKICTALQDSHDQQRRCH